LSLITGVSRNPSLRGFFLFNKFLNFVLVKRNINTNSSEPLKIIPVKLYSNINIQKQDILNDNKSKLGIYWIINKVNGKFYIGSAVNLNRRLNEHFQGDKSNIILQKAFKKYSLENFSIEILEYCDQVKEILLERELYYLGIIT